MASNNSMRYLDQSFISECKRALLESKADLLNRLEANRGTLQEERGRGDSADQSLRLMTENDLFSFQNQWRKQLSEIEAALSRIENGQYGICEETEEPIEVSRLKAIPWTRYCLEGAMMRDPR